MKRILFLFLVLNQIHVPAFAQATTSPYVKINRLSRVIKGVQPTFQEREEVRLAIASGTDHILISKKIDEYLKSDQHAYKMSLRLDELFHIKTGATPIVSAIQKPDGVFVTDKRYYRNNALNYLFTELAKKNLSWDELLVGKSYRAFNQTFVGFEFSDWGFLGGIIPQLQGHVGVSDGTNTHPFFNEEVQYEDIRFSESDLRVAGAITTSRFFSRYGNTGVNKNRRRAAAVFRIFLCDSMSAAVSSSEGLDQQILDLMFPHDSGTTEDKIRNSTSEALHGSDPACMACHEKLDPMGRTLLTSQSALSPRASSGALFYKRSGTTPVNIKVKGVGELGKVITQQNEYKQCQVRHFWKWFMGDVELSKAKEQELVQKFDQVGHRTNDFIKVLLEEPAFFAERIPLTEDQLRARQVKAFFKKCQDCHKDQFYEDSPDFSIPNFTLWPIGGSTETMKTWVKKIYSAMDMAHDGENPRMPPSIAAWRTRYKEMQLIKNWIEQGSPDEKGQKLVPMENVK